jgi:hypothetical protein
MRRTCLLCCTIFFLSFSSTLYAKPTRSEIPLTAIPGYEIGLLYFDYQYEEEVDGQFFMMTDGYKYGFSLAKTNLLEDNFYSTIDFRLGIGEVDYESAGTGTAEDEEDNMWELHLIAGQDVEKDGYVLSPFWGFGYRYLYNDARGTSSTGASGYRRISEYYYFAIGLTHRFRITSKSRLSTSLEYDYLLKGYQTSYLSDTDPGYNDLNNDQPQGYGLRGSMAFETMKMSVNFFYNYWDISDSDQKPIYYYGTYTGYVGREPKNWTDEYGVQVKFRF